MSKEKNIKISSIQLFILMAGFIIGSSSILTPASAVKQDAWLAFIIGWTGGFALISVYAGICILNPSLTLVEILQKHFGKYVGNLVALLYVWYFIHLNSLVFRNFGEFYSTVTYVDTPILFFIICLSFLVSYTVISGLEVTARIGEFLLPVIPMAIFLSFLGLLTSYEHDAWLPFLSQGFFPVLKTGFSVQAFPFGETVAFLMIFPYLNKPKKIAKTSFLAFFTAGGILFLTVLRDLMALGADLYSTINFPPHFIAKLIPGISIEPLVDINFEIAGGVKSSVLIFASTLGIAQIFKLDDYKPLVTAVAVFSVVLSMWVYQNAVEMFLWAEDIYPYYVIPFQIVFPLVLLVLSWLKKKNRISNKPS